MIVHDEHKLAFWGTVSATVQQFQHLGTEIEKY